MDQYEVRKFPGRHHHILTCMLGHYVLWHLKIRLGKKASVITHSQLRLLLKTVLPLREFDIEMAIKLVAWLQHRNHRAYLSHSIDLPSNWISLHPGLADKTVLSIYERCNKITGQFAEDMFSGKNNSVVFTGIASVRAFDGFMFK
jgi:hypothetical protein